MGSGKNKNIKSLGCSSWSCYTGRNEPHLFLRTQRRKHLEIHILGTKQKIVNQYRMCFTDTSILPKLEISSHLHSVTLLFATTP